MIFYGLQKCFIVFQNYLVFNLILFPLYTMEFLSCLVSIEKSLNFLQQTQSQTLLDSISINF